MNKTYENCIYCERDVTLRWCAIKDPYTFVNPDDSCEGFISKFGDMENSCVNLYSGCLCYLTLHKRNGDLVVCPCAYPQNCKDCKDYKPKKNE